MPYIEEEQRLFICGKRLFTDPEKQAFIDVEQIETAGDMQYAIAVMIKSYMERKGLKYQHCNDVMGALAGAQQEFYRRTVAPYEDKKIEENGDV
jgi:hypothetical protein